MRVQDGAVLALGDVADQRQYLALLADRDATVLLSRAVELADGGAFEGADGSDLGSLQPLRAHELCQRGDRLTCIGR
jgi:hypothetical protein